MIARMGRVRTQRHDLPRRMYFDHGAYYLVPKGGKKIHLGRDYVEAIQRYAALVQPVVGKMRISAVLDIYITDYLPKLKPETQENYGYCVPHIRKAFGDMWPEDLEPHHVYAYLDQRSAKVRANREIAVLSNVMQLCIRKGLLKANPCRQVRRNKETPRTREVSQPEVVAFLPYCPEWLQAYIELKTMIGLRQGDMLRLTMFNLRDDGLFCETGKRGKRILFTWTPALRLAVDNCKKLRRKPSEQRLFPITARGFKSAWARAMHKYIPDDKDIAKRFAENDLRAKVASEAIDLGMDATSLMGHSSDAVTRRHYIRGTRKVSPLR